MNILLKKTLLAAGILALGVGAAQPVGAQVPGAPAQRFRVAAPGLAVHYIAPIARGGGVTEYLYGVASAGPRWAQGTYAVSIGFASPRAARRTAIANYTDATYGIHIVLKSKPSAAPYGMWAVVTVEPGLYCQADTGMTDGRAVIKTSIAWAYSAAHKNPCIDALESARHITDGLVVRLGSSTQ